MEFCKPSGLEEKLECWSGWLVEKVSQYVQCAEHHNVRDGQREMLRH